MQKTEQNTSHVKASAFIDFKPAEIRLGERMMIVFYDKNPLTKKLVRQRVCVPVVASNTERMKVAKKMVLEINTKLQSGWNTFYSSGLAEFKTFEYCQTKFLEQIKKEVETGAKRIDTLRSYTSFLNMINKYIAEKKIKLQLIAEFNGSFVVNYLDWIFYERGNAARTYNNHLLFIGTFVNYCIARGYLKYNFTTEIATKQNEAKIRQILPLEIKTNIKELKQTNFNYFVLCMCTYFCFIRRTELTKLQVKHFHLNKSYIHLPASISKNRKDENVTIPNELLPLLAQHLQKANNEDFIFSGNNFLSGTKQLDPKKISDTWELIRKRKNIPPKYQFYSLKDTGITDLLNSGIAAIKVRDQARHYDLKITEGYTPRNVNCDETVRNSNLSF